MNVTVASRDREPKPTSFADRAIHFATRFAGRDNGRTGRADVLKALVHVGA